MQHKRNYLLPAILLLINTVIQAQPGSLDSTFNGNGIIRWKKPGRLSEFTRVCVQSDGKILTIGNSESEFDLNFYTVAHRFLMDGSYDPDFADNGNYQSDWGPILGTDGDIQEDGKITLMSNALYFYHGIFNSGLLPNGADDPGFGVGDSYTFNEMGSPYYGPYIRRMDRQTDKKMVGFGNYYDFTLNLRRGLVMRFLPNGKRDSTFSQDGIVEVQHPNSSLHLDIRGGKVQPDGKIIAIGNGGVDSPEEFWFITRLMPDGAIDSSFGTNGIIQKDLGDFQYELGNEIELMPDGRFIAAGHAQKTPGQHFTLLRFLPDGKLDNTFGFAGKAQVDFDCCYSSINDLIFQTDGKILACGWSQPDNGNEKIAVARLKPNGTLDHSFGNEGKVVIAFDHGDIGARANAIALQQDGKILVSGLTDTIIGNYFYNRDAVLLRLNGDGQVATETPSGLKDNTLFIAPNPVVGPTVFLDYSLSVPSEISLEYTDMYGRKIAGPLMLGTRSEGRHHDQVELPAQLENGAYLMVFRTNLGAKYQKLIVNYK